MGWPLRGPPFRKGLDMEDNFDKRLSALEEWRIKVDIERAAEAVDRKHLDKRLDDIQGQIEKLLDSNVWLQRTIYGAIILAGLGALMAKTNIGF